MRPKAHTQRTGTRETSVESCGPERLQCTGRKARAQERSPGDRSKIMQRPFQRSTNPKRVQPVWGYRWEWSITKQPSSLASASYQSYVWICLRHSRGSHPRLRSEELPGCLCLAITRSLTAEPGPGLKWPWWWWYRMEDLTIVNEIIFR